MMKHIAGPGSQSTITNVDSDMISPNAVDLRLNRVLKILSNDFLIDEDQKVHRGSEEIEPNDQGYFHLEPGCYEVLMDSIINVSEGEAGWIVPRSTLNRNGVFLTSGLYDSGYNGIAASVMHVHCGKMIVKKGTRIGQYVNFAAENLTMYDGDYGLGKDHDKKIYGV